MLCCDDSGVRDEEDERDVGVVKDGRYMQRRWKLSGESIRW